jgi:Spy/CpxP family protein refolding chaperone
MNTKSTVLATALGLAACAGLAIAATTAATPAAPAVPAAPAPAGPPGEIRAHFAQKLGLTAEQQKAIDDLRAKQHAEMMALLTPEQQKQAAEMRGQMQERFHQFAQHRRAAGRFAGDRGGPAMQSRPAENPLETIAKAERIKDQIAIKLQLTDEQRDKLDHLGRAFRAQQRDAARKHMEEMRAVLTPEQQQKFEQLKRQPGRGHPPFVSRDDGPADDMDGDLPPPDEES